MADQGQPGPRSLDRVPPHSQEAEQCILGAILIDPRAIAMVADMLRAEDFYREDNARIFEAALQLFRDSEPIDAITVAEELRRRSMLERVGGRTYLAELEQMVPTAANVEYYGRIVREHSTRRSLITAGGDIARIGYDQSLDSDDALNRAQALVFGIAEQNTQGDFEKLYDLVEGVITRVQLQRERGGTVGVPSGFYDLDALTNGFKPSDLIIVAGRPSMGKTSFALNVARHAAVEKKLGVAIFSLEMSKDQLVERMLCEQAEVDAQRMHKGLLSDHEQAALIDAAGVLAEAPMFIDDTPGLDELTMLTKARRIKAREDIGMVVIDYLQLMQGRRRGDDSNRVQEVSQISRSLKAMARELKVPVIAISQLSRGPEQRENKRPMLSDLRESGSIEQDADMVLFVFRPEYYKAEEKPGVAEIILAKNRNGPTDTIELLFRRQYTRFDNRARVEAP